MPLNTSLFNARISIQEQIAADIRQDIFKNRSIGDRLPSEAEFVKQYHVARTTIQRSLKELEEQGVIERIHGKGSYVKLKKPQIDMFNFSGFSDYARRIGATPVTKIINKTIQGIGNDQVLQLTRLRGIQQENEVTQLTIDESRLRLSQFPGLENYDLETRSLYETLRQKYNVNPATANLSVTAILPSVTQIELLEESERNPLLEVAGNVVTYENELVEHVKIIYSSSANFKFIVGV